MRYRPEIDGLRAVAVLPVIFSHAGFDAVSGGFVGVDVFFVISGYLITSILVAELGRGDFSIARFYERRARRILPALFVVIAACLPFAWLWMMPAQLADFGQSVLGVTLFASNILFWLEEGYFAPSSELKPLLHTWSLAVEEQYYLLFPLFLALV
ncbi:MAG TPA: acyltransferase, partial [Paracoccus sp. (in: a-proteobacteria)]|nr:acyltransferase [Paracoccus sp. (in: a-proteobacteria)]